MSKHFTFTRMPFGISTKPDVVEQFLKDAEFAYKWEERILNWKTPRNEERKKLSHLDILDILKDVAKWRTYPKYMRREDVKLLNN